MSLKAMQAHSGRGLQKSSFGELHTSFFLTASPTMDSLLTYMMAHPVSNCIQEWFLRRARTPRFACEPYTPKTMGLRHR